MKTTPAINWWNLYSEKKANNITLALISNVREKITFFVDGKYIIDRGLVISVETICIGSDLFFIFYQSNYFLSNDRCVLVSFLI